ncbi:histidinol dehydrogenase [Streptomyces violaceusniger]
MSRVLKQAQGAVPAGGADPAVADIVAAVINEVRAGGDDAVRRYSAQFDGWSPVSLRLSEQEISKIVSTVPDTVLDDLRFAQRQVRGFARLRPLRRQAHRHRPCPAHQGRGPVHRRPVGRQIPQDGHIPGRP